MKKLFKKKQRWIHALAVAGHVAAIVTGWRYLPPYLLHNPGIQILLGGLIVADVLHFLLHDE